jgi:cobalamin biosynthetic protein CobC
MNGDIVHGGGVTAATRLFGGRPEEWLDLSTGINPNPVALPEISVAAWHRLPDEHRFEAARLAARDYYNSRECLPLPVPGTQSVIQLLPRLVQPGRRIAIVGPTYAEYEKAFMNAGLGIDRIGDLDAVSAAHALVVCVNPNNPDGRVLGKDRLRALNDDMVGRGGFLVVDEAFCDMTPAISLAAHASQSANLIVLRSFGKFFGLAGLRLGFIIAPAPLLARFEDWLGPWAVSGPALSVAASVLSGDTGAIRRHIAERRRRLGAVLRDAGLKVVGGTDLFALVADRRAGHIYSHLGNRHILVRKFDYASEWVRFGLAPDEHADKRLSDALADLESR